MNEHRKDNLLAVIIAVLTVLVVFGIAIMIVNNKDTQAEANQSATEDNKSSTTASAPANIRKIKGIQFTTYYQYKSGRQHSMFMFDETGEEWEVGLASYHVIRDENTEFSYITLEDGLIFPSVDEIHLTAETYDKYKEKIENCGYELIK